MPPTRAAAAAALLAAGSAPVGAEMYDVLFPDMVSGCKQGCADWADLAGDGNSRKQSDVDAKWETGKPPSGAGRVCAMPAQDPDKTYWCYCRNASALGDSSYTYCRSPTTPVVEQLNLQHASSSVAVASFVTFGEAPGVSAEAQWALAPAVPGGAGAYNDTAGVTHVYAAPYDGPDGKTKRYYFHFVKLSGLRGGAQYNYRVRTTGSAWSAVHAFAAPRTEAPTRAAIFGDMGVYRYNNMANLAADIAAKRIDTIFHLGDHAYNMADSDGTRGDGYVNAFSHILANFSWVPVLGNHEFYGDISAAERYVNMTYGEVYGAAEGGAAGAPALAHNAGRPVNALLGCTTALGAGTHGGGSLGKPSQTSRFYSVDIGLIHFVSLDLNVYYFRSDAAYRAPQLEWLAADLAAAAQNRAAVPWIVAASHYPLYSTSNSLATPQHNDGGGDDNDAWSQDCWSYGGKIAQVRADLEPLFAAHGVDLYFAGHEHNYESLWPVLHNGRVGEKSFANPLGPVHFTTGAGGAPALDTFGATADFVRKRLSAWGYGRVTAHNATHFTYDHILNEDGSVYDTVTVVRPAAHGAFPYPSPPPSPAPPAPAPPGAPVYDVTVIEGSEACPAGYAAVERLSASDADLNQGAGGAYIYLCVARSPSRSGQTPVTGLLVATSSSSSDACPGAPSAAAERAKQALGSNGDLNHGAQGKYLYLCVSREAGAAAVTGVAVAAGAGSGDLCAAAGDGWAAAAAGDGADGDANQGTPKHNDYINICVQH